MISKQSICIERGLYWGANERIKTCWASKDESFFSPLFFFLLFYDAEEGWRKKGGWGVEEKNAKQVWEKRCREINRETRWGRAHQKVMGGVSTDRITKETEKKMGCFLFYTTSFDLCSSSVQRDPRPEWPHAVWGERNRWVFLLSIVYLNTHLFWTV